MKILTWVNLEDKFDGLPHVNVKRSLVLLSSHLQMFYLEEDTIKLNLDYMYIIDYYPMHSHRHRYPKLDNLKF